MVPAFPAYLAASLLPARLPLLFPHCWRNAPHLVCLNDSQTGLACVVHVKLASGDHAQVQGSKLSKLSFSQHS